MEKLICPECQSESSLQSTTCVNCGFPLDDIPPTIVTESVLVTEEKVIETTLICPECQSKNSLLEKACQNCGAPFESAENNLNASPSPGKKMCPECQAETSEQDTSCQNCGYTLTETAPKKESSEAFKPSTAGFFKTSELIQEMPELLNAYRPDYQRSKKVIGGVCLLGLLTVIASVVMRPTGSTSSTSTGFSLTSMLDPAAANRSKISSVKANMHTLQTLVETYAVDWGGHYPKNLETLQTEAVAKSYWKDVLNPFNGSEGLGLALMQYVDFSPSEYYAGMVLYEPLVKMSEKEISAYKIYGTDEKGQLINDKGQVFFLSSLDASELSEYTTPSTESVPTETSEVNSNSTATSSSEEDVVGVVKNWQNIKRDAFVNGNTASLSSVLTGKALTETEGGVNWWRNNGTFYSIELDSLEVVSTSLNDSNATVIVKISETKNNSVNGRKSSTYTATYGLEKINGSWYISSIAAD